MSLYEVIFEFFKRYIWNYIGDLDYGQIGLFEDSTLTFWNVEMTFDVALSHLCTWIVLGLVILFFIKITIWIFKFFGGLFKW